MFCLHVLIIFVYFLSFKALVHFINLAIGFMLTLILKKTLHHYLRNCHYADILVALPSKYPFVGNLVKVSLALLCRHLDHNQLAKSLSLTQSDICIILKVLSNKIPSKDEEKMSWHTFTRIELLLAMKGFCLLKDNCLEFIKQGGLSILSSILDSTEKDEQEATLLLLWQLSYSEPQIVGQSGTELMKKVCRLPADEGSNLFTLTAFVPHCLLQTLPEGKVHLMNYM